jgi:hypothetical protein
MIDRTDTLFGYNKFPNNVSEDFSVTPDPSSICNYFRAIGQMSEGLAQDAPSQAEYGLFEETGSLSDVADANILVAYAGAEVAVRATPRITYNFTPFIAGEFNQVDPFEHYDIGDIVYLSYDNGLYEENQRAVRIFGFSVQVNENGNEKVTNVLLSP